MAGKGGGAWKVAYADFVTAMMAFFMVMWLTAQKPEVKQAVAGYFRDPYAIFHGSESGAAAEAQPVEDPKRGHDAASQRRRVSNTGDDANYQFAVLFAADDATLDATAREDIRTFAPTMVGKLNRVEVRAHCQRKPLPEGSPFQDLLDLCYARGRAVQQELEAQGIAANRIRLSQAGANEPLAANLTPEELRLNSRVDVILLDDLVDSPWQKAASAERGAAAPPAHGKQPPAGESGPEQAHAGSTPTASADHGGETAPEAHADEHAAPTPGSHH
jgi:chemotaxis protein MotB